VGSHARASPASRARCPHNAAVWPLYSAGLFPRSSMRMPHADDKLTLADTRDLADAVAFALRFFEGRKRKHDADAFAATIAAERVVRHLERAGFVLMTKPPLDGRFRGAFLTRCRSARPSIGAHETRSASAIERCSGRASCQSRSRQFTVAHLAFARDDRLEV
jgi:hypothetical protein